MIVSENPYPLFGIMLQPASLVLCVIWSENRYLLSGSRTSRARNANAARETA